MPGTVRRSRPRSRQRLVGLASVLLAFGAAGTAAAYVNASGSGTGQVRGATTVSGVTIVSSNATILPGQPTPLDITLANENAFPARITQVTAKISRVTSVKKLCTAADFSLVIPDGPPVDVPAADADGDGVAMWPGATLALTMTDRDQNDCLGASVLLRYTAR
jgi:hypothetical protein